MTQRPKYECSICGHKSNPQSENQKRSISMHVRKEHPREIPDDADVSEFWTRIVGETDDRAKKEPLKPSGEGSEPKNVVYVVQAQFETSFEAESEAETFVSQKPDVEDYMDTEGNHILIRCSTKEKANAMTRMLNRELDPVSVEIFTEKVEPQSEGSFVSGIGSKITGELPFKGSQEEGEQQRVPPSVEEVSQEDIIGHSVSADDYRHFQRTRADATDVEGLMMARQQIAKGERLGGRDWTKIAVALVIALIGIGVFVIMLEGQNLGGMIPNIGGGGGASIP